MYDPAKKQARPERLPVQVGGRRRSWRSIRRQRTVDLKRTVERAASRAPSSRSNWVRTKAHQAALYDLGAWVADHGIQATGPDRAGRDLLFGLPPRVGQWLDDELRRPGESDLAAARRLALALDHTTLAIQGPPGSGKTYTGARMICSLLAAGKRVGITGTSHKVIGNLLTAVVQGRRRSRASRSCRSRRATRSRSLDDERVTRGKDAADVRARLDDGRANLAAGTSWLWASREDGRRRSMSCSWTRRARSRSPTSSRSPRATDSLVLLGDPQQLDQPLKGSHPRGRRPVGPGARPRSTPRRCRPTRGPVPREPPGGSIPTCATSPRRCSTTIASSRSRGSSRQRVDAASVAGRRHRAAAPRDPHDRRRQRVSRSRRTLSRGSPMPIVDGRQHAG